MVWSCPKLCPYWRAVADTEDIWGIDIPLYPLILLLSHLEDIEGDRYVKLCLTYFPILRQKGNLAKIESDLTD